MIAELRVRGEGIDVVPEDVKQVVVADLAGVVHDLDGLRVPGPAG
jgi:hypothetical protein